MATSNIKRIAVFTSGGDAPGMNAAIRAVVRTAAYHDLHIYGVHNGYEGMIEGDLRRLDIRDVGNIIYRGGTILKTARSERFRTPEGRRSAYEALLAFDIDACVAIGGDGTFTGAKVFSEEYDIPFIGIPGTIDNDLAGTDYTIGYDTAVNTAVQAVDKIRDTADSHNRLFFVEVMGRNSGYIALSTGIASGAGNVLIPEVDTSMESLLEFLRLGVKRKKLFGIIVVAEGNKLGSTHEIAKYISEQIDFYDTKVTIIGHMQRGGSPTALDRLLASRLGYGAVEALLSGVKNQMIGLVNNEIQFTPFEVAISQTKIPNQQLVRMAEILAI
ncbi:MAG: 6-phosphofructokinase [Bacteroidetes bacterium]|nr:MAG: 6-phosphofructokinase [Bacteroidota bacterium]